MKKTGLSKVLLILFTGIAFYIAYPTLKNISNLNRNSIWADAEGYYMYLPAIFIYQNFSELPLRTKGQFKKIKKTGNYYSKYTNGVAIMQAPFFLIGHNLIRYISGAEFASGFTPAYSRTVHYAALFYTILGLFIVYKCLRIHYSLQVSCYTILSIFFGTNLLYYLAEEPGMSHVYSFFLIASYIGLIHNFYNKPTQFKAILISIILAFAVFVRPTNCIIGLYLICYNIESIKERLKLLYSFRLGFSFIIFIFTILILQQMYLWLWMYGEPILYSYTNEQGFIYFLRPKIFKVWFGVWNGLFLYAPILLVPVCTVFYYWKKEKNFWLIGCIFLLCSWVFGSWWAWWFGGAYGHRSFIEFIPFLSMPLAYMLNQSKSFKLFYKLVFWAFIIFCIYYSICMTNAYTPPWDGKNWTWDIFLNTVMQEVFCIQ